MSDNQLTLYKLIILFMLERVDFPLTTSQLSQFILDKGLIDSISLSCAIIFFAIFISPLWLQPISAITIGSITANPLVYTRNSILFMVLVKFFIILLY